MMTGAHCRSHATRASVATSRLATGIALPAPCQANGLMQRSSQNSTGWSQDASVKMNAVLKRACVSLEGVG